MKMVDVNRHGFPRYFKFKNSDDLFIHVIDEDNSLVVNLETRRLYYVVDIAQESYPEISFFKKEDDEDFLGVLAIE